MSSNPPIHEGDDGLAAEYALGLLEGEEQARARKRLKEDVDFARLVTNWEMRLSEFTHELPPQTPRPEVKKTLETRLFSTKKTVAVWQRVWVWQLASVCSFLVAAFVYAFFETGGPGNTGPIYTAEIVSKEGDFRVVAVVDKTVNEVFLTRTEGAASQNRILQVWTHGEGEPAYSVGLWPSGDTVRLTMPERMAAIEGVMTLGISEEPPGGSQTGSPSGRIYGTVDIPNVSTHE